MYKLIEGNQQMTANEASVKYPNSFILIRQTDGRNPNIAGEVLFIGDDYYELFRMVQGLNKPSDCIIIEGLNHQRSLGGVVAGG